MADSTEPLHILMTLHYPLDANQGAGGATIRLAEAWRCLGHDVETKGFGDLPSRFPERLAKLSFPWFVAKWASRSAIDVLDASTGDAWLYSSVDRRNRPLIVCRSHSLAHLMYATNIRAKAEAGERMTRRARAYYGHYQKWEVARSLRASDLALFLNRFERDFAIDNLGVRPERTAVVPNGLPAHFIGLPAPEPAQATGFGIAVIGTFASHKGGDRSLAALRAVLANRSEVRVSFLGPGAGVGDLSQSFSATDRSRVRVVAQYEHGALPGLLKGHQIMLLPGRYEPFGLAALEAMACGLVPIVAEARGPREFIEDGVTGIVVDPATPETLTSAIEALASDPQRLHGLRRAAHAAAQEFDWRRIGADQIELFRRALAARRERAPSRRDLGRD